jgi:hypothetical protein
MAYTKYKTQEEKEREYDLEMALIELRETGLDLSRENVNLWFGLNKNPSPTLFALDFHLEPSQLSVLAKDNELVRYVLYRMIGTAEEQLYWRVFGPRAVIQRVETLMGGSQIKDSELGSAEYEDGLFVSA